MNLKEAGKGRNNRPKKYLMLMQDGCCESNIKWDGNDISINNASRMVLEQNLTKLWSRKMGSDNSKNEKILYLMDLEGYRLESYIPQKEIEERFFGAIEAVGRKRREGNGHAIPAFY